MELKNESILIGIGGLAVGVVSLCVSYYTRDKVEKVCKNLDTTIDKMSKSVDVEIPERIVERSLTKAIEREVASVARFSAQEARRSIEKDVHKQVSDIINETSSDMRKKVADELVDQVSNINISRLKDDVREKASKKILDRFDGELDDIVKSYTDNLNNVSKIYRSIADSVVSKDCSNSKHDFTIRLD